MPLDGVILGHWVSEGGGSHLEGLPGLKEEEVLLEERRAHCFLPVSRGFPACLPEGGLPRGDRLTAAGRQTHSTAVRGVEAAQGLGPGLCGSLAGPEAPASWLRPPHHRDQSPEQQALCPGIAAGPTWVSVSLTFRWAVGLWVSKRRPPPRQVFRPGSRANVPTHAGPRLGSRRVSRGFFLGPSIILLLLKSMVANDTRVSLGACPTLGTEARRVDGACFGERQRVNTYHNIRR